MRIFSWLDGFFKGSTDSSYGRLISFCAFVNLIVLNYLVAINPWSIFTNLTYIPAINEYLLWLVLAGYSIVCVKEIIRIIAMRFGVKFKDEKKKSNKDATKPTDTPAETPDQNG